MDRRMVVMACLIAIGLVALLSTVGMTIATLVDPMGALTYILSILFATSVISLVILAILVCVFYSNLFKTEQDQSQAGSDSA